MMGFVEHQIVVNVNGKSVTRTVWSRHGTTKQTWIGLAGYNQEEGGLVKPLIEGCIQDTTDQIVVICRRGSECSPWQTFTKQVDEVWQIVRHLNDIRQINPIVPTTNKICLFGHSAGAAILREVLNRLVHSGGACESVLQHGSTPLIQFTPVPERWGVILLNWRFWAYGGLLGFLWGMLTLVGGLFSRRILYVLPRWGARWLFTGYWRPWVKDGKNPYVHALGGARHDMPGEAFREYHKGLKADSVMVFAFFLFIYRFFGGPSPLKKAMDKDGCWRGKTDIIYTPGDLILPARALVEYHKWLLRQGVTAGLYRLEDTTPHCFFTDAMGGDEHPRGGDRWKRNAETIREVFQSNGMNFASTAAYRYCRE